MFRKLIFGIVLLLNGCITTTEKEIPPEECNAEITTYYLIRHAEKDRTDPTNEDPQLTEASLKRAQYWSQFFETTALDAIYSTKYKRTRQTAAIVAREKNLEVLMYDADALYASDFQSETKGKTVLVVGHSNTTPKFVNTIIGETKYPDIDDRNNGSLYIVTVCGKATTVQVLQSY